MSQLRYVTARPTCTHLHLRCRTQLLKLAVPLVKQHGFTRAALVRSVLDLPEPHTAPLPESTVTTLFGEGDTARRTLISAWLEEGRTHMRSVPVDDVKSALLARLEYNVPVLEHLPEVPLQEYLIARRFLFMYPNRLLHLLHRPDSACLLSIHGRRYSMPQALLTRRVERPRTRLSEYVPLHTLSDTDLISRTKACLVYKEGHPCGHLRERW